MDTLGELVARDRRSRDPALRVGANPRYDYHQFCTTAQKTGNFFSHYGVRTGSTVALVSEPGGTPLLSLFGAALLGARVRFDPPRDIDARLLVAPAGRIDGYRLPEGGNRVAYDGTVDDPAVDDFGAGVWSENPHCPSPPDVTGETPVVATGERTVTHRELLDGAKAVVESRELDADDAVAIRAALARPGAVTAGVIAPLLVGGTIVFPDDETVADCAVATGDVPEKRTIEPSEAI